MRLTPGSLALAFKQKFGHGFPTFYYRDIVRPRILRTPPVTKTDDPRIEIHVLTSISDWLNLIWTLKSFYHYSQKHYRLCIHADRSLNADHLKCLQSHFPNSRIISRAESDQKMAEELRDYPKSLHFRNTNILAPKVFDFRSYLEADRMALFDSDLLFFACPDEYLKKLEHSPHNIFNSDFGNAYTVDPTAVRELTGITLQPLVNSGLGLIHRDSIRWDWTEEFLGLPGILDGHFWRIEQTLFALCSSRYGLELLSDDYKLYLEKGLHNRPFRHYVGRIRHLMYLEGIRSLTQKSFLKNLYSES
jgi:hypothetical protein